MTEHIDNALSDHVSIRHLYFLSYFQWVSWSEFDGWDNSNWKVGKIQNKFCFCQNRGYSYQNNVRSFFIRIHFSVLFEMSYDWKTWLKTWSYTTYYHQINRHQIIQIWQNLAFEKPPFVNNSYNNFQLNESINTLVRGKGVLFRVRDVAGKFFF